MAREHELFGVTVGRGTKIYYGTLVSVVFGVPLFAVARGWITGIRLWFNGVQHFVNDLIGWYEFVTTIGIIQATRGFEVSTSEFTSAIGQYGLLAYPVSVVVGAVATSIILLGVTYVVKRI